MIRRDFLKYAAVSFAGLAGGCAGAGKKANVVRLKKDLKVPRLILLYAPCTVNKNLLSPYNDKVGYTPHLRRFASRGAVFTKHQVESGVSGVSYASLFSGCQADRHGIFEHPRKMDDSVYLITEAFTSNAHDVYFWDGHSNANGELNYGQGARRLFGKPLASYYGELEEILKTMSEVEEYRVFILTNFTVTHYPYYPADRELMPLAKKKGPNFPFLGFWDIDVLPEEFEAAGLAPDELERICAALHSDKFDHYRLHCDTDGYIAELRIPRIGKEKFVRALEYLYKLNIARLDRLFGKVVNKIEEHGLLDDSLIVFTVDHGETLYRDNSFLKFTHGYRLAPEDLSAPLLIGGSAAAARPGRYDFVTRSIDVFPTIAGMCGLITPANFEGADLSPVLRGTAPPPSLLAYSHTSLLSEAFLDMARSCRPLLTFFPTTDPDSMWVSVRAGDEVYKLAKFDERDPVFKPALFDLKNDPFEENNLFDPSNARHAEFLNNLVQYKKRMVDAGGRWREIAPPDISKRKKLKKLKGLGYIR